MTEIIIPKEGGFELNVWLIESGVNAFDKCVRPWMLDIEFACRRIWNHPHYIALNFA